MYLLNNTSHYEKFTNDEAVKNVASLYNQAKLSVTDFTSTGNATLNNTTSNNATITNLTSTNATINGTLTANAIVAKGNSAGNTAFPGTDGSNYISGNANVLRGGPTIIQGDLTSSNTTTANILNVNGTTTLKGATTAQNLTTQGDLTVNGTTTTKGNVVHSGRNKFRIFRNAEPGAGWDLANYPSSNIEDCITKCNTNQPNALSAVFYKNNSQCYCKGLISIGNPKNTNTDTAFFI